MGRDKWDEACNSFPDYYLNHSSYFLRYLELSFSVRNYSFGIFDDSLNEWVALCPVFIENATFGNETFASLSIGGGPLPIPLVRKKRGLNQYKRDFERVMDSLNVIYDQYRVARVLYKTYAMTTSGLPTTQAEFFFPLSQSFSLLPCSNFIADLTQPKEILEDRLSKSHAKKIKVSQTKGQTVLAIDSSSNHQLIDLEFEAYKRAHILASGRQTRPDESFNSMRLLIHSGIGVLFVTKLGQQGLSYLYCDTRGKMARGWSQANDKNAEKEHSPRHFLEWSAMLYFKSRGVSFYEIGSRAIPAQFGVDFNEKLVGISDFKERFGASEYPEAFFEKILDPKLSLILGQERLSRLIGAKNEIH